jgi:hypothetical protein
MDKKTTVAWLTVLLCILLLLSSPVTAMESDSYAIKWDTLAGGVGSLQSASYVVNSTIGQPVIGFETSTSYQLGSGYWYGVTEQYAIYLPLILRSP